jgi:phosphoglycerol transferase MdoB-like AlkP superfamily enzyme
VVVALLANVVLDLLQSGLDAGWVFGYELGDTPAIFLLSTAVVWLLLVAVVALTGRLWLSCGLMLGLAFVVGFANVTKMQLRQEPLYPSDLAFLEQGGFLAGMVEPRVLVVVALAVALVVGVSVLLGRVADRAFPRVRRRREPRLWRRLALARLVVLAVCLGLLAGVIRFNQPGNPLRQTYEAAGAQWAFWFQMVNYARHGFVAGYLYNLPGPVMTEPADYSEERMTALGSAYAEDAQRRNRGRDADALDDLNIVVVLSEALSDPTTLDGVALAEDPLPFTRSLMASTRSGEMLAQMFGGGTANMEFEALTGQSLSQFLPQMNTPYPMLVSGQDTFPSAVGYLAAQGHGAIAVHPYTSSMYKRPAAYSALGFSDFVDQDAMTETSRLDDNDFVSDSSAYDEVVRRLRDSDEPLLVNLVTMQNHYPMAGKYADPVGVTGVTGDVAEHLSHYARGLRHSDDALRRFLADLRHSGERTAVVVYGDHAPAFWAGEVYEKNGDDAFLRTPWLMWTSDRRLSPAKDRAPTSPIYFLPELLDSLDAPLPPFYELLLQLQEEIPAMEQGTYYLPDGRKVTEDELPHRARRLLEDYRLVQYDLAVGRRWSEPALLPRQ